MDLTVITPDKKIFEGTIQQITLPGSAGAFQILENHAPLVSSLQKGVIRYRSKQQEYTWAIESGFVEVGNNTITVLLAADPQQ